MSNLRTRVVVPMLLLAFCAAGCASASRTIPIARPTTGVVARVADVQLPRGTGVIVRLVNGETIRGALDSNTQDRLELRSKDATGVMTPRGIDHADIVLVARVVKMSKGARGCLGAAIGAVASLAFAISMFGDMMVPGAIVGALIGRGTGDSRAEVVFERPKNVRIFQRFEGCL